MRWCLPASQSSGGAFLAAFLLHILRMKNGESVNRLLLGIALLCFQGVWNSAWSQTFEINGQSSGQTQEQPKKGRRASSPGQSSSGQSAASGEPSSPLGAWGGSLQAGRYARATQEALRRGNFAAAVSDAQHLTEIAPNDARNWFLLSYA